MALGFVRSIVELLTCGRGRTPVRGFHQLTCPLLYRLALMLVFGLCVWTSSVTTLGPNPSCSIGFDGSAAGIAQSLACTRKLGKCRSSEGLRSLFVCFLLLFFVCFFLFLFLFFSSIFIFFSSSFSDG